MRRLITRGKAQIVEIETHLYSFQSKSSNMKALAFSLAVMLLVVGRCQGGAIPGQTGSQDNTGSQSGKSGSSEDRPGVGQTGTGGGNTSAEPCRKIYKNCLQDFRLGATQTRLFSNRRWLEA